MSIPTTDSQLEDYQRKLREVEERTKDYRDGNAPAFQTLPNNSNNDVTQTRETQQQTTNQANADQEVYNTAKQAITEKVAIRLKQYDKANEVSGIEALGLLSGVSIDASKINDEEYLRISDNLIKNRKATVIDINGNNAEISIEKADATLAGMLMGDNPQFKETATKITTALGTNSFGEAIPNDEKRSQIAKVIETSKKEEEAPSLWTMFMAFMEMIGGMIRGMIGLEANNSSYEDNVKRIIAGNVAENAEKKLAALGHNPEIIKQVTASIKEKGGITPEEKILTLANVEAKPQTPLSTPTQSNVAAVDTTQTTTPAPVVTTPIAQETAALNKGEAKESVAIEGSEPQSQTPPSKPAKSGTVAIDTTSTTRKAVLDKSQHDTKEVMQKMLATVKQAAEKDTSKKWSETEISSSAAILTGMFNMHLSSAKSPEDLAEKMLKAYPMDNNAIVDKSVLLRKDILEESLIKNFSNPTKVARTPTAITNTSTTSQPESPPPAIIKVDNKRTEAVVARMIDKLDTDGGIRSEDKKILATSITHIFKEHGTSLSPEALAEKIMGDPDASKVLRMQITGTETRSAIGDNLTMNALTRGIGTVYQNTNFPKELEVALKNDKMADALSKCDTSTGLKGLGISGDGTCGADIIAGTARSSGGIAVASR